MAVETKAMVAVTEVAVETETAVASAVESLVVETEAMAVATAVTRGEGCAGWEVSRLSPSCVVHTSCSEPTCETKACGDLSPKVTRSWREPTRTRLQCHHSTWRLQCHRRARLAADPRRVPARMRPPRPTRWAETLPPAPTWYRRPPIGSGTRAGRLSPSGSRGPCRPRIRARRHPRSRARCRSSPRTSAAPSGRGCCPVAPMSCSWHRSLATSPRTRGCRRRAGLCNGPAKKRHRVDGHYPSPLSGAVDAGRRPLC